LLLSSIDTNGFAVVEIRKLIDQQISRGVAPSLAVVTSVLSYFYSWTSSKVQHLICPWLPAPPLLTPPLTPPPHPPPSPQVGSGVGEEFVAAHRTAQQLAHHGFSIDHDFWCCDRLVNVTLQVGGPSCFAAVKKQLLCRFVADCLLSGS
jgi:hypothetical protein